MSKSVKKQIFNSAKHACYDAEESRYFGRLRVVPNKDYSEKLYKKYNKWELEDDDA